MQQHSFEATVEWTGNTGTGTSGFRSYERRHEITVDGKPGIPGSSDPAFRGDPARYNPEDLLVASVSACHMLWYLGLCANAGLVVTSYLDRASGTMALGPDGGGRFTNITLHPVVTFAAGADMARAAALHGEAHAKCFIANSVNFEVEHRPTLQVEGGPVRADANA